MSNTPRRTFSGSDQRNLEHRRVITPTSDPGLVRISRRRFNNSSSDDSTDATDSLGFNALSLTSSTTPISAGSPLTQPSEPDVNIDVPLDLHSVQALMFMGLSEAATNVVHTAWLRLASDEFADFCDFAKDFLKNRAANIDTGDYSTNWSSALRRIGADEKLIAAITKPGYDEARLTKTALGWIVEAMDMRWEFLLWGEAASKSRAEQIERQTPIQAFHAFTYSSGSGQTSSTSGTPPGETVIWKATSRIRAEKMWSSPLRQGAFDIESLVSQPPGDFNGWSKRYYFTPDLTGAQYYLRYIKDIASAVEACLVRISVPNRIIEAHSPYVLRFPSDEFKQTVFHSRRGKSLKGKVDIVLKQKLLIGDTTKGNNSKFHELSDWTKVEENHLVKLPDGSRMTQYVFAEDLAEQISEHCASKTFVLNGEQPTQPLRALSPERYYQQH